MLDRFVIDLLEAERVVGVGVIVERDAVEPATARVARDGRESNPTVACVWR